ncbi:hypothetical protein BGX34_001120 [Mortierella sp. NVP85]|nr:hypothetical protein BGX34_001120 [Mortierella sp. NVP85]
MALTTGLVGVAKEEEEEPVGRVVGDHAKKSNFCIENIDLALKIPYHFQEVQDVLVLPIALRLQFC